MFACGHRACSQIRGLSAAKSSRPAPTQVSPSTPRLLINRERAGERDRLLHACGVRKGFWWGEGNARDALFEGDCDAGVQRLCELLGWDAELQALIDAGAASAARHSETAGAADGTAAFCDLNTGTGNAAS